jgi:hypothetical protein
MLSQPEHTVVLRAPRLGLVEMNRELKASSARLLQVQSWKTLAKVCQGITDPYPLEPPRSVRFMDEQQTIRPPREYVVPQVPQTPQFVFPQAVLADDPAALTQNELNRFRHTIYESDRQRFNETVDDLNRRNRR